MAGNNIRRNFVGDCRPCSQCQNEIIVTESMAKRSKYWCGLCDSKASANWAKRNPAKKRNANKAYFATDKGKQAILRHVRGFRARHPEKYAAHIAVQSAIRSGLLIREACERCGEKNAHAHHDDYQKQLEVRWLCVLCHVEHHAMLAAREGKS